MRIVVVGEGGGSHVIVFGKNYNYDTTFSSSRFLFTKSSGFLPKPFFHFQLYSIST